MSYLISLWSLWSRQSSRTLIITQKSKTLSKTSSQILPLPLFDTKPPQAHVIGCCQCCCVGSCNQNNDQSTTESQYLHFWGNELMNVFLSALHLKKSWLLQIKVSQQDAFIMYLADNRNNIHHVINNL